MSSFSRKGDLCELPKNTMALVSKEFFDGSIAKNGVSMLADIYSTS